MTLGLKEIKAAHARIQPLIHRTPVLTCSALNRRCKAELFFKCENFQKAGAFKMRGAANAVFSLKPDEALSGVATHSSGNHAAALALAAQKRGIEAFVVMPENAPSVKCSAVAGYGAEIIYSQPTQAGREEKLKEVLQKTGACFIHPYNNLDVISGQGTAALELCEDVSELDVVMAPVGGGGLLSGTALAVAEISPQSDVIGVEPEKADDACRSIQAGMILPSVNPDTIADGLLTSLGELTFPIIQKHVKAIVTVSETEIKDAMRLIWERMKIIVEPSGDVPFAALLSADHAFVGRRVGIILSGGNVDLANLPWNG